MKFTKHLSVFEIVLTLIVLGAHLYAARSDAYNFPNAWFGRDDAYYYFKVAQNIAEGAGSTFDGINRTNGYHPLWMLICIPVFSFAKYDLILPLRILLMVNAVFQAASSILIYRLIREHLSTAVAMGAASFWAFYPYIHATVYMNGLETSLAVFTLLWLIYRLSKIEKNRQAGAQFSTRQLVEIALIATLVMFSRLDLVFFSVLIGVWIVFRNGPLRYLLPMDSMILFGSMTSAVALRTGLSDYFVYYAPTAVEMALVSIVIHIPISYFFGTYLPLRSATLWTKFIQVVLSSALNFLLLGAYALLRDQLGDGINFPRSALFLHWGFSIVFVYLVRIVAFWFSSSIPSSTQTALTELVSHWKIWLKEGSIYYGILGGFLSLYMLLNKLMFGTSSPVSGQIKRWWGSMPITIYEGPPANWRSFFGINRGFLNAWEPFTNFIEWLADYWIPLLPGPGMIQERYYLSMALYVILGLLLLFSNKPRTVDAASTLILVPVAAASGIHILSYSATAYGGIKEWYWVSELVLIILFNSLLIDLILRPFHKIRFMPRLLQASALFLVLFMANNFVRLVSNAMPHGIYDPTQPPMEVVTSLEENTPPGSVIGMTGGGNVGYFIQDRVIVNMDGLINSFDYFQALQTGQAAAYLREHGITIVFANAQLLTMPPYNRQFTPYLEKFNSYGGKGFYYVLDEPKE